MRGRKPIPRAMRVIQGSAPAKPDKDEVVVDVSIPEPPDHLTPDEKAIFRTTATRLARMGVMAEEFTDSIAMYAVEFQQWLTACDAIREEGPIQQTKTGYSQVTAWQGIKNRSHDRCQKLLAEFGLTASSMSRLRKQ